MQRGAPRPGKALRATSQLENNARAKEANALMEQVLVRARPLPPEGDLRLQIELPPGAVLTGLARRVFAQGTVIAFDGARLDTLQALMREEGNRDR